MPRRAHKPAPDDTRSTRERLADAAAAEFNERGFHGTDTNRIARRAGFAPQTFYRHFADKTDAFIDVYRRWQDGERRHIIGVLHSLADRGGNRSLAVAAALIASHRQWRIFRRSLRLLALEDERVRGARADSRRAQLDAMASMAGGGGSWSERVARLLTVERLCDAVADDEVVDLKVSLEDWQSLVAQAVERLSQ